MVLTEIPFELNAEELAATLRVEPEGEDWDALNNLLERVRRVAKPKAVFAQATVTARGEGFVELDGVPFRSAALARDMASTDRAFPYAATCGVEADELAHAIADPLEGWWMDAILFRLLLAANDALLEAIGRLGVQHPKNHNPGTLGDWPMDAQPALFALLGDVEGAIGVRLSGSNLMFPAKSVSGIYFRPAEEPTSPFRCG